MVTANCGQLQQYTFDVNLFTMWPSPGLFSGGCYSLEQTPDEITTSCICHQVHFKSLFQ